MENRVNSLYSVLFGEETETKSYKEKEVVLRSVIEKKLLKILNAIRGKEQPKSFLVVKPSLVPGAGNGVFVDGFIGKGELVCMYQGNLI